MDHRGNGWQDLFFQLVQPARDQAGDDGADDRRKPEQPKLDDILAAREQGRPVLRAGLTEVLVTGIDTRWISVRPRPIGIPANPAAAPLEVQPMMMSRKKNVINTSIRKHDVRLYLPGLRSP